MISRKQILLARTMLDLSQQDLAQTLGMTRQTISDIEKGITDPPASRLQDLESFFGAKGIEFLDGDGLRMKQIGVTRYRGRDELRTFMDDVYTTAKTVGGDICLFNGIPAQLRQSLGADWYAMHADRMQKIKTPFDFKVIVREDEKLLIGKNFATYRGFPQDQFHERTIYAYGNKLAFMNFDADDVRVLVLDQGEIADSFRVLFNIAWDKVAMPIAAKT